LDTWYFWHLVIGNLEKAGEVGLPDLTGSYQKKTLAIKIHFWDIKRALEMKDCRMYATLPKQFVLALMGRIARIARFKDLGSEQKIRLELRANICWGSI